MYHSFFYSVIVGFFLFIPDSSGQDILGPNIGYSFPDRRLLSDMGTFISGAQDTIDMNTFSTFPFRVLTYGTPSGGRKVYGITGQELMTLMPGAVAYDARFVPNIFCKTSKMEYIGNGKLKLTLPVAHGLQAGDLVRIQDDDNHIFDLNVLSTPSGMAFTIKDRLPRENSFFVYGKWVTDFNTPDLSALVLLNLRINRMLTTRTDSLFAATQRLEQEVAELKLGQKELSNKYHDLLIRISKRK